MFIFCPNTVDSSYLLTQGNMHFVTYCTATSLKSNTSYRAARPLADLQRTGEGHLDGAAGAGGGSERPKHRLQHPLT